jgi:nuclear transport factor 2 (NTF2) superfamily protein
METKPPLPPFTLETATAKVQAAEDAWNTCDPERVALAYPEDSEWRNRIEFITGRAAIKDLLTRKWAKEGLMMRRFASINDLPSKSPIESFAGSGSKVDRWVFRLCRNYQFRSDYNNRAIGTLRDRFGNITLDRLLE